MSKILVSKPKNPNDVLKLICKEQDVANVLAEDLVIHLSDILKGSKTNVMLEKTRIGYILVGVYDETGKALYEIPGYPEDIFFWEFM